MKLIVTLFVALVLAMGAGPTQAGAAMLTPNDFDTLVLGTQVAPDLTTEFMTPDLSSQEGRASMAIGTLTGRVWSHNGTYTYELIVTPFTNNPLEFNTGFGVLGFDPTTHQAGYSFGDATAAGVWGRPASAFTIIVESDGTFDWNVRLRQLLLGFWSTGDRLVSMRFFIQSSLPPGLGVYNLAATGAGFTENYAPIGE